MLDPGNEILACFKLRGIFAVFFSMARIPASAQTFYIFPGLVII